MARGAVSEVDRRADSAVVAQIDHRIGKRLERVVHVTDAFEAQQQPAELVFLGEHALDGAKAFVENGCIEAPPATALRRLAAPTILGDIGNHATVKDRLAIGAAIIDPIQTDGRALQIHADRTRHLAQSGQCITQQGRFVTVARRTDERRDDVAAAITEGHHFRCLCPL